MSADHVHVAAPRPLAPEQTAADKRITHLHITACPGLINTELLSDEARAATDFTVIDPLIRRRNHAVRNNNVTTFTKTGDGSSSGGASNSMMTEKQMAARMTSIGLEMWQAAAANQSRGSTAAAGTLCPMGYRKQGAAPPVDKRSTYRADYRQRVFGDTQDGSRRGHLETYREGWSAEEASNVHASMKQPFLTFPETLCRNPQTVYRAELTPEAEANDFRTLSHKVNLSELGTTFAYSAYTMDDPRRAVPFDAHLASLSGPRDFLHSVRGQAGKIRGDYHSRKEESERQRMRMLRAESLRKSAELRESRKAGSQHADGIGAVSASMSHRADDYIYLPRV